MFEMLGLQVVINTMVVVQKCALKTRKVTLRPTIQELGPGIQEWLLVIQTSTAYAFLLIEMRVCNDICT